MTTYKFVPEHNGIEIYFDEKPSISVCEELKENGWRWHRVKKCWFTKRCSDAEAFAKKLCGEKPTEKFVTPPSSPAPTPQAPTKEVSFRQNTGSVYVSTATIVRNNQGFWVSSTNNQIICCDCNKFFSVHAMACPFCGCPMGHVAQHYLDKYDPEVLYEQEKQRQAQLRRQRIEESERKERIIKKLQRKTGLYGPFLDLRELDTESFNKAVERAEFLADNKNILPDIAHDDWYKILTLSDEAYAKKIAEMKSEKKEETDRAAVIQSADKALRRINRLQVEALCKKHEIPPEITDWLLDTNASYECLQAQIARINYYAEVYPNLGISLENGLWFSEEELKDMVSDLLAKEKKKW